MRTEEQANNLDHSTNTDNVFISAREMLENEITEIPMLWGHFFQKYGLAVISGSSDVGKSSFMRQFAIAIVTGQEQFLNYDLHPTHNKVIYVSSEDDYESLSVRFKMERNPSNNESGYENLLVLFDGHELINKLENELERQPFDCIIIDSLGDFINGEMNALNRTRQFYSDYITLCRKYKCLVIFLHHTRKTSSEYNPNKYDVLGSQGLEAKPRSVLLLSKHSRNMRKLTLAKANYVTDDKKDKRIILSFDDNFIFENTGETEDIQRDAQDDIINNRIRELHAEGNSYRRIEEKLEEEFGENTLKRTAIGNRVKKMMEDNDVQPSET